MPRKFSNIKMSKILYSVLVLSVLFFQACKMDGEKQLSTDLIQNPISAEGEVSEAELPKFKFKKTDHDFGKIIDGVKVAFKFRFTNVGGSDLLIHNVKTTCGCTVSRFPREPIAPGESAFIELTFDSDRRGGFNHKTATVLANTQPNVTKLSIKATVVKADEL